VFIASRYMRPSKLEIDIVGDKLGQIYVGSQDLRKMQTRKMRAFNRRAGDEDDDKIAKRSRLSTEWVLAVEK
jgi:hypothetical protein